MTEIRTARLTGSPVTEADAGFAVALFGRPEVGGWTGEGRGAWDAAEAARRAAGFAAHWAAHGFGLRVWRDAAGAPAALAGLQFCVIEGRGEIEAAFAVPPERQGAGLAREALAAVLAEAPGICREVAAVSWADNRRALAVLRGAGFAKVGRAGPGRILFRRRTDR